MRVAYEQMDESTRAHVTAGVSLYGHSIYIQSESYAHTIGMHPTLPDLLVLGPLHPQHFVFLLNSLALRLRQMGRAPLCGEYADLGDGCPVVFSPVGAHGRTLYTRRARDWYGHENYSVVQVVVPDPELHLPGQPGVRREWAVPLLATDVEAPARPQ